MAIARNLSAVVEVVEDAELQRQLVLVRSDVLSVHREGGIAVSDLQISEYLVVSAILFDDVDDVLDRILAVSKDCSARGFGVAGLNDAIRRYGEVLHGVDDVDLSERSVDQRRDIGVFSAAPSGDPIRPIVWTSAGAFGARD